MNETLIGGVILLLIIIIAVVSGREIKTPWGSVGGSNKLLEDLKQEVADLKELVIKMQYDNAMSEVVFSDMVIAHHTFRDFIESKIEGVIDQIIAVWVKHFGRYLVTIGVEPTSDAGEKALSKYEALMNAVAGKFILPMLRESIHNNHFPVQGEGENDRDFWVRFSRMQTNPLLTKVHNLTTPWITRFWHFGAISRKDFIESNWKDARADTVETLQTFLLQCQAERVFLKKQLCSKFDALSAEKIETEWKRVYG